MSYTENGGAGTQFTMPVGPMFGGNGYGNSMFGGDMTPFEQEEVRRVIRMIRTAE